MKTMPRRTPRFAVLALVTMAACGGSTVTSQVDAGGHDAASDGAPPAADAEPGQDAVANDALAEAGYLACFNAAGQLDGSLKICQADADCVIEQEQTDCCGTILYVGVAMASVSAFGACETAWVAHFPGCGCESNKTSTEDGKTSTLTSDAGAPQVHCTDFTMSSGICLTYTP
jgi:hypothetical protein